jgi:hypothetical protein
VRGVMMNLKIALNKYFNAFCALIEKYKNPEFVLAGEYKQFLIEFGFVNEDGVLFEFVADVLASALVVEGDEFKLVQPIDEDNNE